MRSRTASPQTSPQVVRGFRVEESREREGANAASSPSPRKPSLRVEALPKSITMNGLHTYSSPMSNSREVSPGPSLLSPIPNGVRKVSGGDPSPATSLRSAVGTNGTSASGQTLSAAAGEDPSPGSQWSSAVGPAAVSGKSGRVIERLMAENDKLKRELELQVLRVQELEKTTQTYRPQMDALLEKVDSLSHASTMDANLIQRRDRRIEELKTDNAHLKEGRDSLQKRLRDVERDRDEIQEQGRRDVQSLTESTKHATLHAEILAQSHRQLSTEYRTRREAWEHDLKTIHERQDQEHQRLARLDVVYEQMRQESERTRKIHAEMVSKWAEYEAALHSTRQQEEQATDWARQKSEEMEKVINDMRWLMGIHKVREETTGGPHGS